MRQWAEWLSETPWSVGLRESLFVWPVLEASHVMSLMLFVGTIIMVDLRLVGWAFLRVPVSEFDRRILPWTVAGFILLAITGALLFYAKPLTYYDNLFFRIKLVLLAAGFINLAIFHKKIQRSQAVWDSEPRLPTGARIAGFVSLAVWASVIIVGRLIAYDWYDCPKLDPDGTVAWLAGCESTEIAALESF